MSDLQISAVIVCDEIRREVTGKDILIGVYSGDIIVPEFPAQVGVAFWIEVLHTELRKYRLELRLRLADKEEALPLTIDIQPQKLVSSSISTPSAVLMVEAETDLLLERLIGSDWQTLKAKKIMRGDTLQPFKVTTGAPPPFSQS